MTPAPSRMISLEKREDDLEASIRPQTLLDFTGQEAARKNLKVFIEAAKARKDALDHVLFVGPPGLGKTTLAQIVARELGVNFRSTSGPVIAKAGDLAAQLTNLEERDVLFIDEIHRLNPAVEEILYPAMEDFQLDLIIGEGPAARSVKIDLARFTLVGATTRAGLLTTPLRDRFGIPIRMNFYNVVELQSIVARGARVMNCPMSEDGANEIARRSRGTPRIAGRLLRRVRDFALVDGDAVVTREVADRALKLLDVDSIGLDQMDRRYLDMVALNFGGGPVGIETIAAALSEPRDAIEDIIEPYLLQQGFLNRTPRGRDADAAGVPASRPCRAGAAAAAGGAVPGWRRLSAMQPHALSPPKGALSDGRHVFPIRVYFEDTDFTGIVYHANYLRFIERARTEMLRDLGLHQGAIHSGETGDALFFVVARMQLEFLRPARMDDLLTVETRPVKITAAVIELEQIVRRDEDDSVHRPRAHRGARRRQAAPPAARNSRKTQPWRGLRRIVTCC